MDNHKNHSHLKLSYLTNIARILDFNFIDILKVNIGILVFQNEIFILFDELDELEKTTYAGIVFKYSLTQTLM